MNKHGITGANVQVPQHIYNNLKGIAINQMRSTGRLGPKGSENIRGDKWQRPRLRRCGK